MLSFLGTAKNFLQVNRIGGRKICKIHPPQLLIVNGSSYLGKVHVYNALRNKEFSQTFPLNALSSLGEITVICILHIRE